MRRHDYSPKILSSGLGRFMFPAINDFVVKSEVGVTINDQDVPLFFKIKLKTSKKK